MSDEGEQRHSRAVSPELITDPVKRAEREALNGLRQFDTAVEMIDGWLASPERPFKLRPSAVQTLHRVALDGISIFAGNYRPAGVEISGSKHRPVGAHLVPEAIEEMCDYVNENWDKSAIHLAAYVMWRLNWVHPFDDGNGRTARVASYLVLCVRLGTRLPGINTIPEQIAANKGPYYRALEIADEAFRGGGVDVGNLENYLEGLLAEQLLSVHQIATGDEKAAVERHPKFH